MIDADELHVLLFLRAGAAGQLRLSQSRLADELRTTRLVIHRVLERMQTEGRLRKLEGASGPATRTYEIVNPEVWKTQSAPS